jgi:hypothetical protein
VNPTKWGSHSTKNIVEDAYNNKDRKPTTDGENDNDTSSRGKRLRNNDRGSAFTNDKKSCTGKIHEKEEEV